MKRLLAVVVLVVISAPLFAIDGAALFSEKKCVDCHGVDGSKTIPEKGVKPLNTPATTGKSEEQLAAIIARGAAGRLTNDEITTLAKFVKSLK